MFNINKYKEILEFIKKNHKNSQIIAISKNHPKESVLEAINYGVTLFGENRVMEAKNKFSEIKELYPQIELHLTGPLQSNKVKHAVSLFDVFHTLDREKIALEFSKHTQVLINKKLFVQVNIGEEKSKSGIHPKELREFINYCQKDIGLSIYGLMCIPPIDENPKKYFNMLKSLALENKLEKLSIGMSNDYEIALRFNPEYIRLGTILFGKRK